MKYTGCLIINILFLSCSTLDYNCLEEPKYDNNCIYIKHAAYSVVYSKSNKQPVWVAYQLLSSELNHKFLRTNNFYIDSLVISGTANNSDFKYSGYDKGHLAPAFDMSFDKIAMSESFSFTNISPQLPSFNRGIWKILEIKVRAWADLYDCLYLTTGSICFNSTKSIGENKITIPTYFYKTILIYNDSIQQGIGFLIPHENCKKDIFNYAVTIDSIEKFSNLDFYYKLPNRKEQKIESVFEETFWRNNIK